MPLFKLHGIHVAHHKNTAKMKAVRIKVPNEVIIPMNMHIGVPSKPIVKVGERVLVGQKIAEADGFISVPIHSSVSGKVKKIENRLSSNGTYVKAITIESDGLMEVAQTVKPVIVEDTPSFVQAIKESGLVGLGGAGFPTHVKLSVKDLNQIEEIIINCAECEPYITSDTRTMIDDIDLIEEGVNLLERFLLAKKIIFGIEENKKEAIQSLRVLESKNKCVEIKVLKAKYPQGGEKVLIYHTTGKVIPEGKLPLDKGIVIMNVTTLATMAKYIKTGMPLVEKMITVDGSSVRNPQNVIVPIGTKLKDVFAFCGGFEKTPFKVMYGGPMMGIAVPNLDEPILKNTNAILAFDEKEAIIPESSNCIKCGRCINHCPLRLNPTAFAKAVDLNRPEDLVKYKVNLCMECGVCSYVCPAKRPLVQKNRIAKVELKKYLAELKKKEEEAKNEE